MSIDRILRTEQRWRDIIKDCQESGQSIRSYCLRRGISEGAFHYWRKKLPHQSEPKLNQFISPTYPPDTTQGPPRCQSWRRVHQSRGRKDTLSLTAHRHQNPCTG